MNTTPPRQPGEPTPYRKWMMDAIGMQICLLNDISNSLKEIVTNSIRPRLRFKGKEIIMFEDLAIGLNKTIRTLRKKRANGEMEYYISEDGRSVFMTQEQFDTYIEQAYNRISGKEA